MNPDKAFYVNPLNIKLDFFQLDKQESRHAIKVLRLVKNIEILLLDGIGDAYLAKIKNIDSNIVSGQILKKLHQFGENKFKLNLASAIIKKDRFKTIIEKGTELGVNEFYPLLLDRCIKRTINYNQISKYIISSSKQTKRSVFPVLNKTLTLKKLLKESKHTIIAGVINSENKLKDINFQNSKKITIIIGPEGDFSKSEVNLMREHNVLFYNIGPRILRSETAALYSLSILNEKLR
jgi:16S rRNA (uracil1498-N3)-methyltransferase